MKKLVFLLFISILKLGAQDTIRFTDGRAMPAKVNEITEAEIKYNRWDNITGPVYVVPINEVRYIRYVNGMKDTFAVVKPKVNEPVIETPAYVDFVPKDAGVQKIQIVGKQKLFYDHRKLSDNALFGVVKKHPDQGIQNLMINEFSKVSTYKHNRNIGFIMMYGGIIGATIISAAVSTGNGGVFLISSAVGITGSIIATVNKNKRYATRLKIAKMYNGN
ncbi:MAG: hypothetical protein IPJ32_13740 [Sphingobacteriaceae bacterium]|nr:hypothetical protein [Sphingobacteriaceae bacterium]